MIKVMKFSTQKLSLSRFCFVFFGAAKSSKAATMNAASCEQADVPAAIDAAGEGDTVNVPSGNCIWTSVTIVSKDISIVGAGSTNTKIARTGNCFILNLANTTRISGFGFTDCTISGSGEPVAGKTFRIDDNSFTSASWQENSFNGSCQTPMRHPTGLIDNNTFYNYRTLVSGGPCMLAEGDYQHQLWAQVPPKGDGTGIIYIEDNAISSDPNIHQNWIALCAGTVVVSGTAGGVGGVP